jgi:hypothetical protein
MINWNQWNQYETIKASEDEIAAFRLFWERLSESDQQAILENGCIQVNNEFGQFVFYPVVLDFNVSYRSTAESTSYALCTIPKDKFWLADYEILFHQLFYLRNATSVIIKSANNLLIPLPSEFHRSRSSLSKLRTQAILTAYWR